MVRKLDLRLRIWNFALNLLASAGRVIAGLRAARWLARQRGSRITFAIASVVGRLLFRYLWLPARRLVRGIRRFLGRHEVWAWLGTWGFCALLAVCIRMIAVTGIFLQLLIGGVAVITFALVSFRSPVSSLLFWLIASPLFAQLLGFKFARDMPAFSGDRVALGVLLIVYLAQVKREHDVESNWPLHLSMLAVILTMLVAGTRCSELKTGMRFVVDFYILPIVAYLLARRWITNQKSLSAMFTAMLIIGFYYSAFAIPEHFLGRTLFHGTIYVEQELETVRVQGPAASPTEFGVIVTASLALALVRLSSPTEGRKRLLYMMVVAIVLMAMSFTLRRGIYVGVFVAVVTLMIASRQARKAVMVMLALTGFLLLVYWQGISHTKVYTERIVARGPVYARAVTYATAWNIIKAHPVLGVGIDNWRHVRDEYISGYKNISASYGRGIGHPHNTFLRVLVESGLMGFLPVIAMLVMMLHTSYRIWRRVRGDDLLGKGGLAAFWALSAVYLAQTVPSDALRLAFPTLLWFFFLGGLSGTHLKKPKRVQELA
jgi:O-antigen ligase